MTIPHHAKRLCCLHCLRPQSACICDWVTPISNAVEVLILQHPLEVNVAKGSARLLKLSLCNSQLAVGEIFDPQELHALLYAPFHAQQVELSQSPPAACTPILLYPKAPQDLALKLQPSAAFDAAAMHASARLRLVVLDGTWRKSRKMLYLNPLLQSLPRLPLSAPPRSRYLIRKAHKPDQLSTLEACCQALMQLENDAQKYQALLQAFDGFVAQQASYQVSF